MQVSMILAASGAILAMATPLNIEKRKIVTSVVFEWKTVYVTEGLAPSVFAAANAHHHDPRPTDGLNTHTTIPESQTVAPVLVTTTLTPTPDVETVAASPDPTTVAPVVTTTLAPSPEPTVETAPAASSPPAVESPEPAPAAPVVPSSAQTLAAEPTDYASTAVYHHNLHRMNYSAPAIEWSSTYADYAGQTAAKCVFAHDLTPGGGGYGQNLALFGSTADLKAIGQSKIVAQSITDMWHNGEVNAYPAQDFGKPNPDMSNFEAWGHFSQLVWVGSEQVGCVTQYCDAGTIYPDFASYFTVCNYFPAGNMGGGYGQNVLPPLNEATVVV